jgi:hypothetical protein
VNYTGSGTFAVRASAGERAAWRRQAASEGLSRNESIRKVCNAASGGLRPATVEELVDERQALLDAVLPLRHVQQPKPPLSVPEPDDGVSVEIGENLPPARPF